MKKMFRILVAGMFYLVASDNAILAQQTKSGAPLIPIPAGDIRKQPPESGAAPKIRIGKAEISKLANGLTVIVVENHKLPRISVKLFVDFDPVLEKDTAGLVDLTGEMLTKVTTSRSKAQIDEEVDFMGATLSSDAHGLSGACLSKHTDQLLAVMADALLRPSFPVEEFEKAKSRNDNTLTVGKDNPNTIAANLGAALSIGKDHP